MALVNAFDEVPIEIARAVNDDRTRLDYDTRTDGNPVYVGAAAMGTADTDNWRILRLTYDSSGRLIDKQYQFRSWATRAQGWI